ncbi:MAG TPA: NUDIX hydrolase [Longimicrobiaceae bacterium]
MTRPSRPLAAAFEALRAFAMRGRGGGAWRQVGALVWRRGETLEVLLVTSRESHRWIIPKGWPMRGRAPHEAAAQEALEEAGVTGRIEPRALGTYEYRKRLKDGSIRRCVVTVYPLEAQEERSRWRERGQRKRRWFPAEEAASRVREPEMAAIIRDFAARLTERGAS